MLNVNLRTTANSAKIDCPPGSHLPRYDDQQFYVEGLLPFIRDVDVDGEPSNTKAATFGGTQSMLHFMS